MTSFTIGFIGLGLIGGSIAKALKKHHPSHRLICYNHDSTSSLFLEDLTLAIDTHVIDEITPSLHDFSKCDVIFLCVPILCMEEYFIQLKDIISENTLLTDVGSVKGYIHTMINKLGLNKNFIGGHPMTGSEKTGFVNSNANLLENAYYIMTPSNEVPKHFIHRLGRLVKDMRAILVDLDYENHDNITAAISHLPHIIASSLVDLVKQNDNSQEDMKRFAAGGFKDITRIASASPNLWQNICLSNTSSILVYLDKFIDSLEVTKSHLVHHNKEGLLHLFFDAKEYRDSLPILPKSLGIPTFELYVDLNDETGSLAKVAILLASHQISIKNIGILHNREFEEGALTISFYTKDEKENATCLLEENNYTIYKR